MLTYDVPPVPSVEWGSWLLNLQFLGKEEGDKQAVRNEGVLAS